MSKTSLWACFLAFNSLSLLFLVLSGAGPESMADVRESFIFAGVIVLFAWLPFFAYNLSSTIEANVADKEPKVSPNSKPIKQPDIQSELHPYCSPVEHDQLSLVKLILVLTAPIVVALVVYWLIYSPGGMCMDGWSSPSIGKRGACSHHGGVKHSNRGLALVVATASALCTFVVISFFISSENPNGNHEKLDGKPRKPETPKAIHSKLNNVNTNSISAEEFDTFRINIAGKRKPAYWKYKNRIRSGARLRIREGGPETGNLAIIECCIAGRWKEISYAPKAHNDMIIDGLRSGLVKSDIKLAKREGDMLYVFIQKLSR